MSRSGERSAPAAILFGGVLLCAVGLGLVAAGYSYKAARERRYEAIAATGGNPDLAQAVIIRHGCGGCHTIPGIAGASGKVGPPLKDLARQIYIGGVLPNTATNLVNWIVDPHVSDPKTAMPATGITPEEARDVAAYLYSLR
jgi:cytochrome c